ncbi:hypothetical protein PO909_008429, partial [Leuciscus waleckii]
PRSQITWTWLCTRGKNDINTVFTQQDARASCCVTCAQTGHQCVLTMGNCLIWMMGNCFNMDSVHAL